MLSKRDLREVNLLLQKKEGDIKSSHCLVIVLSRSEDEYLKQSLEIKNTEANNRLELQASLREGEQKQSK